MADKDLLAEAAAELYANDPAEFTRRRAALAAGARTAGDKAAATAITALRKPTRSAWLVNRLVRDDPAVPSRLAALAADLRSAGRALDGARIRELSRARRDLVSELTRQALGGADQSSAAPALREQVSATFGAALADPEVAGEVASGTLLKPVGQAGFGFDAALAAVPEPAVPGRAEQEPAEQEPAEHEPAEVPRGKAATTRRRSAGTEKARAKRAGNKHARAQEERARAEAEREQARIDRENARADRERARAERQRRRQELAAAEQALRDADRAAEEAAGAERRRAGAVGRAEQQLAEERRRLAAAKTRSREAAKAQRDARKALDRLRKLPPPGPLRPV